MFIHSKCTEPHGYAVNNDIAMVLRKLIAVLAHKDVKMLFYKAIFVNHYCEYWELLGKPRYLCWE